MTNTPLDHQPKLPLHRGDPLKQLASLGKRNVSLYASETEHAPLQEPPKWVLIWISLVSACGKEKENVEDFESDWWPWALHKFRSHRWAKISRQRAILWSVGQIARMFIETVLTKTASFIRSIKKTAD